MANQTWNACTYAAYKDVTPKWRTKLGFSIRFSFGLELLPAIDTGTAAPGQCKITVYKCYAVYGTQ